MIDEVWDSLKADESGSSGLIRRRITNEAVVDLFAAIECPSNTPLLLVVVDQSAIPLDFDCPDAAGFQISLTATSNREVLVEVRLLEPEGEAVFRALVDEAVGGMLAASSQAKAFSALMSCVHTWQEFFRRHGFTGLSPSAQQGLFGELWFLREKLAVQASVAGAVSMWVGPTGANQDFQSGAGAYEVKTSTSNPLRSVRINNLRQLDDAMLETLSLVLVEADRLANGTFTLPDAVMRTRDLVRSEAPQLLERLNLLLTESGYLDRDSPRYAGVSYAVRSLRAFRVSEGFPRLTEADVPRGVGNVRYSISLEALTPCEVSEDLLDDELRRMHGDSQ